MKRELEPFDDLRLHEARRAYRELGPSDAQLTRMLQAVEASGLGSVRHPQWVHKLWKAGVGMLTAAGLIWVVVQRQPAPPPALPHVPERSATAPAIAPPPPQETGSEPFEPPTPVEAPRAHEAEAARTSKAPPEREARERARTPRPTAPRAADPIAELALLQRARRVIMRDPARALTLAEEHAGAYPDGIFAEERELLAIEALLGLTRRDDAEQRAARFTRRHPHSVHAHRLQRLLDRHE